MTFRVSEDEYEGLRRNTINGGARSVSEYARIALCGQARRDGAEARMEEIDRKVRGLTLAVQRLWDAMDRHCHGGGGDPGVEE